MANFFIEKLIVTGSGKKPSVIEFSKGLNFIIGPSNTGKSYIIECIDYLFGFESKKNKPFRFDATLGYDCFSLHARTKDGTVVFQRKIDDTKVSVSGTDPNFENGGYSISSNAKDNINDVWLRMMGIDEPHKILSSKAGNTQRLTWRTMLHMFFIKQDYIARTSSVLLQPNNYFADTSSKSTLLFLMTGQDADRIETPEDKDILKAKRNAIIVYIKDTVRRLSMRQSELLGLSSEIGDVDLGGEMSSIANEIDSIQSQIDEAVSKSRQLMGEIFMVNGRLAECETVSARFAILRSQYLSDIERLTFIVEGEIGQAAFPANRTCPFCDNSINLQESVSYVESSRAELSHIRLHLKELEKAENDLAIQQETLQQEARGLEARKSAVDAEVGNVLKPRISTLKDKLANYRRTVELKKEIELIQSEEQHFNTELFERETETDNPGKEFDILKDFDREMMSAFEEKLTGILKAYKYEGYGSAHLDMQTFDLEVNGKPKATTNGGGYSSFLNTVVALALMEHLADAGAYAPGLLVADSPLSQLSESEFKDETDTMKTSLLQYLLSHEGSGQIIIVEQKEKLPHLDFSKANVIEFTKDRQHGRYGFLSDVFA